MVVLLVHPAAKANRKQHVEGHQQMEPQARHSSLDDYIAEIAYKKIYRVEQEQILCQRRISVDSVEYGGHIHQELGEDAPEILDISEEHEQRREYKPHADIEADEQGDGIEKHYPPPRESYAVNNAKQHEHAQRQTEVYEALHVLGQQEEVFRHVHLGEDARVAHQRAHALTCGLVEKREH